MTEYNIFHYLYVSFTNAQLPLSNVAALYFDELVFLYPVDASWATMATPNMLWNGDSARIWDHALTGNKYHERNSCSGRGREDQQHWGLERHSRYCCIP
jgi:hypothetical protein